VFTEFAALAFYFITGYLFRPQSLNPYLSVNQAHTPLTPTNPSS
jgi:hypothetical protein